MILTIAEEDLVAKRVFLFALVLATQMTVIADVVAAEAGSGLNFRIHHEYQSLRALGMGDAFVAVANDYSGLFYNPAGLARREDGNINLYFDFSGSKDIGTFAQSVEKASKETNSNQATIDVLQSAYGKNFSFHGTAPSGIWVRPNWGVAVLPLTLTVDLGLHSSLGPSLNATLIADTIVAYGWAKDFYWLDQGRTSAGFTVKAINRGYYNELIHALDLNSQIVKATDLSEGMTVDADLGVLFTPEIPTEGVISLLRLTKPTFGAVVRNVFDYGFKQDLNVYNKKANTSEPDKLHRRIDIGSRWEYPEFLIFGGRGVMDVRDILHPQFSLKKGMHLGFEFDWRMFSWWRGQYRVGYSQGYLTAGLSALFSYFNFDFATYSEDVGTRDVPRESRKYEVRFNIDI